MSADLEVVSEERTEEDRRTPSLGVKRRVRRLALSVMIGGALLGAVGRLLWRKQFGKK